MRGIITLIVVAALTSPTIAGQYSVYGTTFPGRGPTEYITKLLVHLNAATTKQIHSESNDATKFVYTDCFYTLITTGAKYGQAIQAVSAVSTGFKIANTSDCFPFSTMSAIAYMYWVYRDTYPASTARQDFTFYSAQTGGGAIGHSFGDGSNAAYNDNIQFFYNPNGTGYDTFIGTINVQNDGKWHHIIHVINRFSLKIKCFVDGVKDWNISGTAASEQTIAKTAAPTNAPQDIGLAAIAGSASNYQGKFDEFMIVMTSSRAFTDNECVRFYRDAVSRRGNR